MAIVKSIAGRSAPAVDTSRNDASLRGDARYGPTESEALTLDFVPDAQLADRFRLALDMYEFGEKMTQSRLRRHHPGATDEQIARMLRDWRMERPGSSGGDAAGRPSRQFA